MATDNSDLQSDPLADPIVEIGLGLFKASVVCQAVELGIFDQIENFNNEVTAGILANQYGYNLEVTGRLLNALVCYGLLKKNKNKDVTEYSNTKTTQKYLLKSVQPNLTNALLSDRLLSHALGKFNTILKKGTDTTGYDGTLKGSNDGIDFTNLLLEKKIFKTDQNQNPVPGNNETKTRMNARAFMTQMDSMMCPVVHAITVAFDVADHKTLLDLGGSSGYLAYEFVKTYPQMKAIVLDRPDTIEVAKELQPSCTKSKVEFIEGDFFDDESFPESDLIILSHIIHNWDEDKLNIMLNKTYQSLAPGGSLLVVEKMLHEDKAGPETSICLDIVMATICNGRERTLHEYEKLMGHHGFRKIKAKKISGKNYFDVLLARKPFM